MRLITARGFVASLFLFVSLCSSPLAAELDEHLRFLTPYVGAEWVGGYVGPEAPDIEITLRFEQILDGSAVSCVRAAEAANFSGLTHFFWNPGRNEVTFISLNNRRIVEEGVVSAKDGKIVLRGKSHRPDETIEFKTTLEIDPAGTLRDTFVRMENDEWVEGHVQEFTLKR